MFIFSIIGEESLKSILILQLCFPNNRIYIGWTTAIPACSPHASFYSSDWGDSILRQSDIYGLTQRSIEEAEQWFIDEFSFCNKRRSPTIPETTAGMH